MGGVKGYAEIDIDMSSSNEGLWARQLLLSVEPEITKYNEKLTA